MLQEERAELRVLEAPGVSVAGPWEGAPFVAKELALQLSFGDCGTVHRHEGATLPRAVGVNGGGYQRFPSARLARD
jgi:hypothetical protein